MNQITPFLSNTESLLHFSEKRLSYILLAATLIHALILLTVNINPIMQKLNLKLPNKQLAVSLALVEDLPPELANYMGPKNHSGPLESTESIEETLQYNFNAEAILLQNHIIAIEGADQQKQISDQNINIAPNTKALNLQPPLKRKIISAATHQNEDAAYLYRWQQYIESIASETYPQQALQNNITGRLRLLVALNSDGSVYEVIIRQSSGQKMLDDAALDIVQNAQPFESVPKHMLQDNEIIEIIRTWDFRGKLKVMG